MMLLNEIGSWLLHSAVFGALILLLGGLAVGLCRQPVYRIRIICWTFVAVLLVPLLQQTDLAPAYRMPVWPEPGGAAAQPPASSASGSASASANSPQTQALAVAEGPRHGAPAMIHDEAAAGPTAAVPDEDIAAEAAAAPAARFAWAAAAGRVVQIAYLALAGCLLAVWTVALVRRGVIARQARPADDALRNVLATIAGPRARRARLLVSDRVDSPVVWGLGRPTIVVPAALAAAKDSAQLRWGLAHEWSHVERGDVLTLLLASAAKLACFYQPAYWWLRRQLALSQDYLADAFAARHGESAEDYAAFLVSLARTRQGAVAGTLGIAPRRSNLFRRITMLVQSTRPLLQRDKGLPAAAIALAALLTVAGLSSVRLGAAPIDQPPAAEQKPSNNKPGADEAKPQDQPQDQELDETLPDPITYEGTVLDRDTGEPIAGAVVEVIHALSRDPQTNKWRELRTTRHKTDGKGRYSFTLPPEEIAEPSLYLEVDAHHPNYQPKGLSGYSHTMIRKNLAQGEPPFYETIKLSAGQAITAVVLRPDGTPSANTRVLAYTKRPAKEPGRSFEFGAFQHAKTDEQGRFRIVAATPGDGVLWVFPKDFSPIAHRIGDQRGDIGPLRLQEGVRLSGQVLDAKGLPVAHVGVNVRRNGDGEEADEFLNSNAVANAIGAGAETDEQGRFQLKPLPPGSYRAEVRNRVSDPTAESRRRQELKVEHVFTPLEVTVAEGEPNDPIEIRAVPHVIIRGRFFNGQGKPRASHQQHLFARVNGRPFFAQSTRPGDDGWFEFKVPHGVEEVEVGLTTNEHSALRWRLKPAEPLSYGRRVQLGTLEQDFTTLEVVRYVAPLLLLKAVDENGEQLRDFKPHSKYATRPAEEMRGRFISGAQGDIGFEEQPDGRWRSSQMLPDEEVTITLKKEGYTTEPQVVSMKEKEVREVVFVLKKEKEEEN